MIFCAHGCIIFSFVERINCWHGYMSKVSSENSEKKPFWWTETLIIYSKLMNHELGTGLNMVNKLRWTDIKAF